MTQANVLVKKKGMCKSSMIWDELEANSDTLDVNKLTRRAVCTLRHIGQSLIVGESSHRTGSGGSRPLGAVVASRADK